MELTPHERALLDMLGDWWNGYCELPDKPPNEDSEVCAQIHALQLTIMARLAKRAHPDYFN